MAKLKVTVTGPTPGVLKGELLRIFRVTMLEIGELWHSTMRPKHFTAEGATEYHYKKRTDKYMRAKENKKKHQLPLVWSGESRTRAIAKRIYPRAKKAGGEYVTGVTVTMNIPTLNLRPKGGKINLREELVRTSAKEFLTIKRFARDRSRELVKELKRYKKTQTFVTK